MQRCADIVSFYSGVAMEWTGVEMWIHPSFLRVIFSTSKIIAKGQGKGETFQGLIHLSPTDVERLVSPRES